MTTLLYTPCQPSLPVCGSTASACFVSHPGTIPTNTLCALPLTPTTSYCLHHLTLSELSRLAKFDFICASAGVGIIRVRFNNGHVLAVETQTPLSYGCWPLGDSDELFSTRLARFDVVSSHRHASIHTTPVLSRSPYRRQDVRQGCHRQRHATKTSDS